MSEAMVSSSREEAIGALAVRRKQAREKGRVDNSKLHAGQPMYYYCGLCDLIASVMHEEWDPRFERPREYCKSCEAEMKGGLLTKKD
jgi:hypothetical protein